MSKKMMCPMMMGTMGVGMEMEPMNIEDMYDDDVEKDERYFADMYPESCKKMMPYIVETLDKAEQKDKMIYEGYPDREMIKAMMDTTYRNIVADMPEMADEEEERQFIARPFARDLAGALLLGELLRRRRLYSPYGYYGYGGYYPGYAPGFVPGYYYPYY